MLEKIIRKSMPNMAACKERCNMNIAAWHSGHKKEYAEFKRKLALMENGDMSLLKELMLMASKCIPSEKSELPADIDNILKNSSPVRTVNIPQYVKSYIVDLFKSDEEDGSQAETVDDEDNSDDALLKEFFDYFISFKGYINGFLSSLQRLCTEQNPLLYSFYYWITFDHGMSKMSRILDEVMKSGDIDQEDLALIRSCIDMLVSSSIEHGGENKSSWNKTSQNVNSEIWKEIMWSLLNSRGRSGRHKQMESLDELLIGDRDAIKSQIKVFLQEEPEAQSLAYLLKSLVNAKRIKNDISYMVFHRAIEQFAGRKYGNDKPQQRYNEIKDSSVLCGRQTQDTYKKAKRIVTTWTRTFAET